MITATDLAIRLEGVLGANRIEGSEERLREYAVNGVIPKAIVKPGSAEEAALIVQFALREGLSVIPCGSRSKMDCGMAPDRHDLAMEMTALNQVRHFDAGDLTLSVDAGMQLTAIEKVLSQKGQFLPISVPCYESSTIAGALASGIDSTLRQQYGTVRDFLIGAEFVDGTGAICKSGGRVVKNVTGYDLHKLFVGSFGTLGIITRLNFRTFPMPGAFGGFLAGFLDLEGALAFRAAVEARGLPIANIELLDARALDLIQARLAKTGSLLPAAAEPQSWHVCISYEGNELVVQRVSRELEILARGAKAASAEELEADTDAAIGGVLREAFDWLRTCAPAVALFRITLPGLRAEVFGKLQQLGRAAGDRTALFLRAGNVVYLAQTVDQDHLAAVDTLSKWAEGVFSAVRAVGGSATLLHAPQTLKQRISVWGAKRPDFEMMRRVKQAFDPRNTFSPGRFVGGL